MKMTKLNGKAIATLINSAMVASEMANKYDASKWYQNECVATCVLGKFFGIELPAYKSQLSHLEMTKGIEETDWLINSEYEHTMRFAKTL